MNTNTIASTSFSATLQTWQPENLELDALQIWIEAEFKQELETSLKMIRAIATRMTIEVKRICEKSKRIQKSGEIKSWEKSLARHRINKCVGYYRLGSAQGRSELHSKLSVIVYRYIAPSRAQLGFAGRYNLIEDFMQDFYAESLKAFRRENDVPADYQPKTRLELAEYMAFTEQYAKRSITLPGGYSQQLIILRAQTFAKRMPKEAVVDIEKATEFSNDDNPAQHYSATMQQVRAQLVGDVHDPTEDSTRDRLITALFQYFQEQGHKDCADYLALKLQDLPACEIDEILGLTSRQRDYLQQRFKYHVEKFSRNSNWKIVHQWLGADLEQRLGLTDSQWEKFSDDLNDLQLEILELRGEQLSDKAIATEVGLTPKKVQKQWTAILEMAWEIRNAKKNGKK
ncbi:hypothetical protein Lepto7376_4560 [[Leptolyngbya] sp. PCC 7376]|uniref:HetZ-related protein n=1 Tax=[Leptolyngbya] sp. PCC 7376 TaxID=111781 RepID=UPI00029F18B5|nr:HetZ-related protein [[Leptolyngbya] sp. PCC 7376]AFY40654.1 hypothetical protein Lepto7376_4560 [[Leptolyngbya] sp. PCC 7376]